MRITRADIFLTIMLILLVGCFAGNITIHIIRAQKKSANLEKLHTQFKELNQEAEEFCARWPGYYPTQKNINKIVEEMQQFQEKLNKCSKDVFKELGKEEESQEGGELELLKDNEEGGQ